VDKSPDAAQNPHRPYKPLLDCIEGRPALSVAIAYPCDALSLAAAAEAAHAGLITPILVGPSAKIHAAAREAGADITRYHLIDAPSAEDAALAAVALVRNGDAKLLMKGSLHTDELLHAVMITATGLRTTRRLSHVYVIDIETPARRLLITDAVVNILPKLEDKQDIVQNAIDLAHVLGIAQPLVAILAAVETVNPAMQATLDAASLCKMADRGQITGGIVDGPLAFDNAISPQAAAQKHILGPVAGNADILVVPDLEAGNMLAKELSFLIGADAAGVILGARVPIILTSRADSIRTHVASCALAVLAAQAAEAKPPG
jgi:phosphotransacetylase